MVHIDRYFFHVANSLSLYPRNDSSITSSRPHLDIALTVDIPARTNRRLQDRHRTRYPTAVHPSSCWCPAAAAIKSRPVPSAQLREAEAHLHVYPSSHRKAEIAARLLGCPDRKTIASTTCTCGIGILTFSPHISKKIKRHRSRRLFLTWQPIQQQPWPRTRTVVRRPP